MRRWTLGVVTFTVGVLLLPPAFMPPATVSAALRPLCSDVGTAPVLQDSNWTQLSPGYYNFATQYVDAFIMKQAGQYVIYLREYVNNTVGIYRGASTNGSTWNISKNPVLRAGPQGSWDQVTIFTPDVVWNGTGYMMYYTGSGVTNKSTYPANFRQIGVAFSSDGINWTKYAGNPVIKHGPGTYDSRYVRGPSVLYDNGTYRMWYTGTAALNSTSFFTAIDYATSADGVHWTKYAENPVFLGYDLGLSGLPFYQAYWPSVVKENGTYLMAFSDGTENIGLATSRDGITWSFQNNSAPLETFASWHNGFVGNPSLLLDGQRILLWYYGTDNSNQTSPYVAGVGFATCGLAFIPSPVTSVTSITATAIVVKSAISTSISTSIVSSTFTENPNAPFYEVAAAAVVGFASAMAVAVALVAQRLRSRRSS